jgi:hypothetical protein
MPVTITEHMKAIKDPLVVGIYKNLLRQTDVLKIWPFSNVSGLVARGFHWDELPTPAFRKLYGDYTDTTGTTKPVEEKLAIYGSKFRDPTQQQIDMHTFAIARGFVDNLCNGDVDGDPDSFNGLHKRMSRLPSRQTIHCASNDALDVLASADNAKTFVRKLNVGMKYANLGPGEGNRGAILLNENSWLGVQEAFKLAGYTLYTVDVLEMRWPAYMGIPFVDVGLKLDKSTEIILNTYNPGDDGNDSTRTFIVRFAEPDGDVESPGSDGCGGIQLSPLEVLGPEEYNKYEVYDLEWVHGLQNIGDDYCIVEIDNLKFSL